MNVNGSVYCQYSPCSVGGMKRCVMHTHCSSSLVRTNELKPCHQHPESKPARFEECPVDFYIWLEDKENKRRQLTGLVKVEECDLHNHPHHKERKISVKIRRYRHKTGHDRQSTSDVIRSKTCVQC